MAESPPALPPPPKRIVHVAVPPPVRREVAPIVAAPNVTTHPVTPPVQAAPQPAPSKVPPSWQGELNAWLRAHLRYPTLAKRRGEQGIATIRFTVRHDGRVLEVALAGSSGSDTLDQAALEMLNRANVPKFTDEMIDDQMSVTVGINFNLKLGQ